MVSENDGATPLSQLARAGGRRYAALMIAPIVWLFASPFLLGYSDHALAVSDIASASALAIAAGLTFALRRSAWSWATGVVGLWLIVSPLVLWAPTAGSYASATVTGTLVTTFGFILPVTRRLPGPAIPPGWSYNPSAWSQRVPVIVLALVSYAIAAYMAAFQLGYIDAMWDPVFGDGTRRVLTSKVSRAFPVSDAGLGAATYLVDLVMTCAGDKRRWRTMPWLVIAFGILIIPVGVVSIVLVILQPLAVGAWCSWCLLTAVATLVMIPFAIDEVAATLQLLRRVKVEGRSWTRVFWFGDAEAGLDSPLPQRPTARRAPWTLVALGAAGLWLMLEPAALGTRGAYAGSTLIVGALLIVTAVVSISELARVVRYAALPLAAWSLIAPWILPGATPTAHVSGVLAALVVAASSLFRGPVRERHGELDRIAFWPSRWQPVA